MPCLLLLNLPTELLLSILEWMETVSLYQLALLSRRLNSIALRVYFFRHNLGPDFDSVELKRLETFISRLTFVRKVTLRLASHEGNWSIKFKDADELCAWSSYGGNLLNCIFKRGCRSLTIRDGSTVEPIRLGVMDRVRHFSFLRSKRILMMPRFLSGQSHIATLVINSATFLTSPGIDWILPALVQVTSLDLGIASGSARTWSNILPRIAAAVPHLTRLTLSKFLRAVPELVEHFLAPANPLPELHVLRVGWRVNTDLRLPALSSFLTRTTMKLAAHSRMPHLNLDIDLRTWKAEADLSLGIPPAVVAQKDIAAGRRACGERSAIGGFLPADGSSLAAYLGSDPIRVRGGSTRAGTTEEFCRASELGALKALHVRASGIEQQVQLAVH
ncbi:hypothetical protein C8R45DRAFT_923932 [Mycena sanguinolenta]|nr:hypothetical protein C8R45DRAFT_923932 [Mycena sanguinolenta]